MRGKTEGGKEMKVFKRQKGFPYNARWNNEGEVIPVTSSDAEIEEILSNLLRKTNLVGIVREALEEFKTVRVLGRCRDSFPGCIESCQDGQRNGCPAEGIFGVDRNGRWFGIILPFA